MKLNRLCLKVTGLLAISLAVSAACWVYTWQECPTTAELGTQTCSFDQSVNGTGGYPFYTFASPGQTGYANKTGDGIQHCHYTCPMKADGTQDSFWAYTGATLQLPLCTGTSTGTGSGS
jgi:hypothetical protein